MTERIDALQKGLPERPAEGPHPLLRDRRGRIRTKDPARDRVVKWFLILFLAAGLAALFLMKDDWLQFLEGVSRIPEAAGKLAKVDFSQLGITCTALMESIGVAVLSTVYSMVGGMFLAVLLAKNLTPLRWLSSVLSAALTFLRAIPSIIWVLLVLASVALVP